ncbi:GntR family transcriptional regulator [Pseudalkalibacillus sp. A8]|uniref:GntR family transcriptional regulator n=1 Tax=Pseudalkalibacillus sp. A8 TaxID=3382641 RepID=UPI0038B54959
MKKALYKVIYDDIYLKIQDGTYTTGDLLPSEMELEQMYKASRTPVRQALKKLENDGYIYRLQGKGSFVSNISETERWTMTTGFGSQYSKEWRKISAKTLSLGYIQSKEYARELNLPTDSNIIHLSRIRYFNGEPLVYMEHYIKPVVPISVFEKDYNFVSAVGKLIKEELNIEFSHIEEEMEAVVANENLSKRLNVPIRFPLLEIKRFSYHNGNLIDLNIYHVRTDVWKYKIRFEG